MSLTKMFALGLVALALVGCSASEEEQTIAMQEAKIKSLSEDNNLLVDKNQQTLRERDIYRAKYEAGRSIADGQQRENQALQQVISSKESQIAREREMTTQAMLRAEKARREAAKTVINVPGGYGPGPGHAQGPASKAVSSAGKGGKYHLRIISLPSNSHGEKQAREMASYLESKGISDVVARKSGRFWVIDIGHFSSIRSSEANSLKTKIRGLRYKGIAQFSSAYFAQY